MPVSQAQVQFDFFLGCLRECLGREWRAGIALVYGLGVKRAYETSQHRRRIGRGRLTRRR